MKVIEVKLDLLSYYIEIENSCFQNSIQNKSHYVNELMVFLKFVIASYWNLIQNMDQFHIQ